MLSVAARRLLLAGFGAGVLLLNFCRIVEAQSQYGEWSNEQLLHAIALDPRPDRNFYINDMRVELLKKELENHADREPSESTGLRMGIARELLRAGRSIEAVQELEKIYGSLDRSPGTMKHGDKKTVSEAVEWLLATAYLRIGEQYNCLVNHHAQSCIFPITEKGVHIAKQGSRMAIEYLMRILKRDHDSLSARWLLNLAYMTLGEYPGNVPPQWLIPETVFSSDTAFPRFADIAGSLGVDHDDLAGGCVVEDLNGDGYLDIVSTSWNPRTPLKFHVNDANGSFSDKTASANLSAQVGGLNLTHADYDNDGDNDLFVFRGAWLGTLGESIGNHPNSLLQNDGTGNFIDVTVQSGLRDLHPVHSGAWADFDLDGNLDLFLGNESSRDPDDAGVLNVHRYQLFRNRGDGTFVDVAPEVGLDGIGFAKGVAWGDIDNDGYPDLYVSRLGQPNQLFHNDGPQGGRWRFTDITEKAGVGEPVLSFPVWFWDYDNDGWEDLFVASYTSFYHSDLDLVAADYLGQSKRRFSRLYRNRGDGTFEDVTLAVNINQALLAMGANFGDLDNDSFLDMYIGTGQPALISLMPNRMFRNDQGRGFQDVTTAGGFGHLQKGHGIAFADIDNDGDQDVYAVMGGAYSGDVYRNALFENPGNDNEWVTLMLDGGTGTNRSAIGARVRVTVLSRGLERQIHRTVGAGGSFGSSPLRLTVGLGDAESISSISVTWPDRGRSVDTFTSPPLDSVLRIRQGEPAWTLVQFETQRMKGEGHAIHRGNPK